jgi:hypothetical protein
MAVSFGKMRGAMGRHKVRTGLGIAGVAALGAVAWSYGKWMTNRDIDVETCVVPNRNIASDNVTVDRQSKPFLLQYVHQSTSDAGDSTYYSEKFCDSGNDSEASLAKLVHGIRWKNTGKPVGGVDQWNVMICKRNIRSWGQVCSKPSRTIAEAKSVVNSFSVWLSQRYANVLCDIKYLTGKSIDYAHPHCGWVFDARDS